MSAINLQLRDIYTRPDHGGKHDMKQVEAISSYTSIKHCSASIYILDDLNSSVYTSCFGNGLHESVVSLIILNGNLSPSLAFL